MLGLLFLLFDYFCLVLLILSILNTCHFLLACLRLDEIFITVFITRLCFHISHLLFLRFLGFGRLGWFWSSRCCRFGSREWLGWCSCSIASPRSTGLIEWRRSLLVGGKTALLRRWLHVLLVCWRCLGYRWCIVGCKLTLLTLYERVWISKYAFGLRFEAHGRGYLRSSVNNASFYIVNHAEGLWKIRSWLSCGGATHWLESHSTATHAWLSTHVRHTLSALSIVSITIRIVCLWRWGSKSGSARAWSHARWAWTKALVISRAVLLEASWSHRWLRAHLLTVCWSCAMSTASENCRESRIWIGDSSLFSCGTSSRIELLAVLKGLSTLLI